MKITPRTVWDIVGTIDPKYGDNAINIAIRFIDTAYNYYDLSLPEAVSLYNKMLKKSKLAKRYKLRKAKNAFICSGLGIGVQF